MTRVVPRPKKREPVDGECRVLTHSLEINEGMLGTYYAFFHRLGHMRYETHFMDQLAVGGFHIAFQQKHNSVEFQIPNDPKLIGAKWLIRVIEG